MVGVLRTALAVAIGAFSLSRGETVENSPRATWPDGPFTVSGRWILNASGKNVTYAGVNWPGHGETMVPEGLQYQSIAFIVGKIKETGMNSIRLTYATQMVDEIYANGGKDVDLKTSFANGLGQADGTKILNQVLAKNPQFTASTTRLQVFDAVVAECAKQQLYVHLDNHISKAKWCCSETDGNAWWGDTEFNTANWVRGLTYMSNHGKSWPNLMSMSLRNEPRNPSNNRAAASTYNWRDWYGFIRQGTTAVHAAHPDLLIFLSGLSYDTYITPVFQGTALTPGTQTFNLADFPGYANKLVLEIHNYETSIGSCSSLQGNLYKNGFQAMNRGDAATKNVFPVMLTEFGFDIQSTTVWRGTYATCLASYLPQQKAGWFLWVVAGSYYIRSGTKDYEEAWALLSHDWSGFRRPEYVREQLMPMVKGTLDYTR